MPLREELVDVLPETSVAAESVSVYEDSRLCGDGVAEYLCWADGLVGDEEWAGWVHAKGFAYDAAEVVQVGEVCFGDETVTAHDRVELGLDLAEDAGVADDLRHRPLVCY